MRVLSLLGKRKRNLIKNLISFRSRSACCEKKALSNVVAYVLLITIGISLSVLVYSWLRFYVSEDTTESCSEGVNIIIRSYECFLPNANGDGGLIRVTLKNKGLFTVDGYELRVHDRPGADFGFYLFDDTRVEIKPGDEWSKTYLFSENVIDGYELDNVTLVEVQPFMNMEGEVRCKSYASQEVICQ